MDLFPDFMFSGAVGTGVAGGGGSGGGIGITLQQKKPIIKVKTFRDYDEFEEGVSIKLKRIRNGVQGVLYD